MIFEIRWLATVGFILCLYALYVRNNLKTIKGYIPLCDFRENVSCSKAFLSKEGSLSGFPNPIFGLLFYALVFLATMYFNTRFISNISVLAVIGSVYLAYLSYVKQRNFCLICTTIYLINILILVFSFAGS